MKPYGDVLDEMDHQAKYQSPTVEQPQQLVARIKRSSKYYGQTEPGAWFDVRVVSDRSYRLRGNSNNYRIADVALAVRLGSGEIVELKDGR